MSSVERTPTQTTSQPTTSNLHPKVSRWAYGLIVIGLLASFE